MVLHYRNKIKKETERQRETEGQRERMKIGVSYRAWLPITTTQSYKNRLQTPPTTYFVEAKQRHCQTDIGFRDPGTAEKPAETQDMVRTVQRCKESRDCRIVRRLRRGEPAPVRTAGCVGIRHEAMTEWLCREESKW